jgi:hypothetical protein
VHRFGFESWIDVVLLLLLFFSFFKKLERAGSGVAAAGNIFTECNSIKPSDNRCADPKG